MENKWWWVIGLSLFVISAGFNLYAYYTSGALLSPAAYTSPQLGPIVEGDYYPGIEFDNCWNAPNTEISSEEDRALCTKLAEQAKNNCVSCCDNSKFKEQEKDIWEDDITPEARCAIGCEGLEEAYLNSNEFCTSKKETDLNERIERTVEGDSK